MCRTKGVGNLHSQLVPCGDLIANLADLPARQLDGQKIRGLLFAEARSREHRTSEAWHGPCDVELPAVGRGTTACDRVAFDLDARGKHAAIEAGDVRILGFGPSRHQAFRMHLELHDTHASPRTLNGVQQNAARARHSSKQKQIAAQAFFPTFKPEKASESIGAEVVVQAVLTRLDSAALQELDTRNRNLRYSSREPHPLGFRVSD
ncbi:MAG: hypothetical protein FD138_36, partial [Planctomycetota bacterium]